MHQRGWQEGSRQGSFLRFGVSLRDAGRLRRSWATGLAFLALPETIAVAVHLENVDVVGEPIEQRTGQPLGAEHAGPFVERQIAGNDGGAALVALAEYLEQQLGAGRRERHVTELVDDQGPVAGELALQAQQTLLVPRLEQLVRQGRGRREADREAFLAGRQSQPGRNMALPGVAVAVRDDVLPAGDILEAGQLQHQCLVEREDDGEVEVVESLHRGEPGLLDAALDRPPFAFDQLEFGQAKQIAGMIHPVGGALPGELAVLA